MAQMMFHVLSRFSILSQAGETNLENQSSVQLQRHIHVSSIAAKVFSVDEPRGVTLNVGPISSAIGGACNRV